MAGREVHTVLTDDDVAVERSTWSTGRRGVAGTLLVSTVLAALAFGMWRARYGAVLGMQTLLAITIVFCSVGLVTATSIWAAVLLVLMIAAAGTLFWFLVKAMARLQMPERPGARSG